jgi:hypothetical protein
MRPTLIALVVALGLAASASAQSMIQVNGGQVLAHMPPQPKPYTVGGPWAVVPARARTAGQPATAIEFRVRAWKEKDGARAVVYAVNQRLAEQQIASVFVGVGKPVEIAATEKFNARPITIQLLTAMTNGRRPIEVVPVRFTVEYIGDPIPVRPWQPPPRN